MAKEIISESRLREIISEEAARFKKKLTLEAEKKSLLNKLQEMYMEEDAMEEDTMEEGLFGPSKEEVAANKQAFEKELDAVLAKAPQGWKIMPSKEEILKQAASAKKPYQGELTLKPNSKKTFLVLAFKPELTTMQKLGGAATSVVGVRPSLKETYMEEDTMEEGWFGPSKEEVAANKQAFEKELDAVLAKAPQGWKIMPSKEEILKQAAGAKIPYKGELTLKPNSKQTFLVLAFKPELTKLQKISTGASASIQNKI
jgi:hypothetical protein